MWINSPRIIMTKIALSFEFPANLSAEKFITKLIKKIPCELVQQHDAQKSFYDSFDWRLYDAHLICEFNQSKHTTALVLKKTTSADIIASTVIDKVPPFANDLPISSLSNKLSNLLEMRSLLPLATLELQVYKLNILNKDQKTIARLLIEDYNNFRGRLTIQPIKGYDKAAINLHQLLVKQYALIVTRQPILLAALKAQGRKPNDYSSKLKLQLKPTMPADKGIRLIYKTLLKTLKINETGTIEAIDTEFLHDFRVSIRRTRSGLSQFNRNINSDYRQYFAWLGMITSLTRDLDVYLLNIDAYKASLPESMREDLNPLKDFLQAKQVIAQKELVKKLTSKKYWQTLDKWEDYLKQPATENISLTMKQLGDARIWKVYQQILKEGGGITEQTPAQALHDLRKTCKKLRYLMAFFQSLYPMNKIKVLIKSLKGLQEVLGDFQDYEVQEDALRKFSEEMRCLKSVSTATFLAMGVLVQKLDEKRCQARNDFAVQFIQFTASSNQAIFKSLFVTDTEKLK